MGLYDGIKDVAKVVQKADNIELYQKLLDLSSQALDMQNTISNLVEENKTFKQKDDITNKRVRHDETYITLKEDKLPILYCSCCWDTQSKLVQLIKYEKGEYICNVCKNKGYYDKEKYKAYIENMQNDNNIYV